MNIFLSIFFLILFSVNDLFSVIDLRSELFRDDVNFIENILLSESDQEILITDELDNTFLIKNRKIFETIFGIFFILESSDSEKFMIIDIETFMFDFFL